ncbi:MAG: glucose-6-phosphate isomerase [Chloroflexota bacterium]|nr:glucose-6-phosphate isomerase [Chloroflexota bacterium]
MAEVTRTVEELGRYDTLVESTLARLDREKVVARMWQGDYRVWSDDPTEIEDRLGWLTIPEKMAGTASALSTFASQVQRAGFTNVVLLGMGGSSLGPEVIRRTLGSSPGFPQLRVLDSTLPAWIQATEAAIDPARTIFLVSSKSGTTIESTTLCSHFRQRVTDAVGEGPAGGNFVAITDPSTPLEALGKSEGFRQVFLNHPEIGGRYSVLSYFGMVPAALIGLDLADFLARASAMQASCSVAQAAANPGARLGAIMGSMALEGRDKLTLVTSPALAGFGLWVEQLLAESLGKSGKGIIPVAGEPELPPGQYSNDRLIVYLRLRGDDNAATDTLTESLSGKHPTVQLELCDRTDLGAEFYRWEFATAVAGHILGVHPFDQPNVQGAKDKTDLVLEQFTATGRLPTIRTGEAMESLLGKAEAGDYLAILAYLPDDEEVCRALAQLRLRLTEKLGIPTTTGFGPRYLHSTGQLHKGGPGSGIFLQLTADHPLEMPIPGRPYTFGTLADAQSAGDLQALQELGRRAARVHLGADPTAGIQRLTASL